MKAFRFAVPLLFAGFGVDAEALPQGRQTQTGPRIRESLLQEARLRLNNWYQAKSALQLPLYRDGVKVQISNADLPCGDPGDVDPIPVTFSEFKVADARPIDVFNTLVNTSAQASWDNTLSAVNRLGVWQDEGVDGLHYVYPSGMPFIPDREIFEWAAYSGNFFTQDFMVAFSTLANARLRAVRPKSDGAVEIQNCLAAYWVRRHLDGGTLVTLTHHINIHAELGLSGRFLYGIMWEKDVDWINLMRAEAQRVAKQNRSLIETVVPGWLLHGPPLPARDPRRKLMSPFNLTEKGDYKVQIGAGLEGAFTFERHFLLLAVICATVCLTMCLLYRAYWNHQGNVEANQEKAQDSHSETESDSGRPQSRESSRCVTIA